jgi:hypothetical protein
MFVNGKQIFSCRISYIDDENDECTITCDEEWKECVTLASGTLRLLVSQSTELDLLALETFAFLFRQNSKQGLEYLSFKGRFYIFSFDIINRNIIIIINFRKEFEFQSRMRLQKLFSMLTLLVKVFRFRLANFFLQKKRYIGLR